MPLSRRQNAERMRVYRARRKANGTAILSKGFVRKLHRLGIDPAKYCTQAAPTLGDYRALEMRLEAKTMRIEWQSSGIRMLHQKIAALEGTISMMLEMDNSADKQRITQLEADLARLEAMMDTTLAETPYNEEAAHA